MNIKNRILLSIIAYVLTSNNAQATAVIPGNGTLPFSFNQSINAAVLDKATGTFYVGLASGGAANAISGALRGAPSSSPAFNGIANNAIVNSQPIEMLTTSTFTGNSNPNLALVIENGSTPLTQSVATIMNNTGSVVQQSNALLDASGTLNSNGATTSGIVALAASAAYIFAAVRPSIASPNATDFGDANSGIAVVGINKSNLALTQTTAQPSDTGIKAAKLDPSSMQVGTATPVIEPNQASMLWDDALQRLYIGLSVTTGGTTGNTANSVVVGSVDDGTLALENFFPDSALVAGDTTKIVGVEQAGAAETVTAENIQIMHTSTGPSYLIINGGNGTTTNNIFALPLVDVSNPLNANQGLLANKLFFNSTTYHFESPVTSTAGLTDSTDAAAQVGGGPLPIQDTTAISQLFVAGDTVYVSLGRAPNTLNDAGIFYSQALFNNLGQIINWTPWTKRVAPFNSFPDATPQGQIAFFGVDANNGAVWMVNDTNNQTVRVTTWDEGSSNSLAAAVNNSLQTGCYSVLDLDQSTNGFTGTTTSRYALFGGAGKLIFTQISQAQTATINSPQTVITDFSNPENFLITSLPQPAGAISAIEYTRQQTGTGSNFFFVGTDRGLYAFANSAGNGFDVADLANLNAAPFTTYSWQKIDAIKGAVASIKTTGNALYIMTNAPSAAQPFNYTIYRVPFASTLTAMFATPVIIAQSGTSSLDSILAMYDMQIISTTDDGSTEQLVVSTNNGLYQSARVGGVQAAASQTDANWNLVATSNAKLFNGIGFIDNAAIPNTPPTTVWPFNLADPSGFKIYNGGQSNQLAGNSDTSPFAFVPTFFNSMNPASPSFSDTPPIIYFWSDGARRFLIAQNIENFVLPTTIQNNLIVMPFNTQEWGALAVDSQAIDNSVVNSAGALYWIRAIGASGIVLMGTNFGVIAFE